MGQRPAVVGKPRASQGIALLFASCVLGVVATTSACQSNEAVSAKHVEHATPAPQSVQTAIVREMPVERWVTALGSLVAYDEATLSVKVAGRLAAMLVDFGSVVTQGQEVARIEQRDYQLRVQQAEAALAQARARLGLPLHGTDDQIDPLQTSTVRQARALLDEAQRNRDRLAALWQKGFVSRADYEAAEAAYTVAVSRHQDAIEEVRNRQAVLLQRRAELALARQQLADTVIRAPFAGVIQVRHASVGEYLTEGAPVVTLVRMNPLRLRVEVPERAAPRIRLGQKVRVMVEGSPQVYEGTVMRLGPTIHEQTRMLTVEADVHNDGSLRPGAFVRSEIVTEEAEHALAVPSSAVVTFAGLEKVFVVQNGKAVETPISTGRRMAGWVEVTAGVNPGDAVILEPGKVRSGQPVRVVTP
ncbi:MAG: efflux RND transporter periplasmic adaptor subunit [Candidatus Binatia bacterium]|nr:efflux RND transporter periplasmic adaptor subunit [Candidatus Binatia bacterium]